MLMSDFEMVIFDPLPGSEKRAQTNFETPLWSCEDPEGSTAVGEVNEARVHQTQRWWEMSAFSSIETVSDRLVGFDILRILALMAIIWFHTGAPGSAYMSWRLPTLTIISATLAASRPSGRTLREQVRRSVSRLLIPWLFWCVVYGLVEFLNYLRHGESIIHELGPYVLLSGPATHLWFLPFAFVMVILLSAAQQGMMRLPERYISSLATVLAVLCLVAIVVNRGVWAGMPLPLTQWLYCAPSVLFGLAIGTASRDANFRGAGTIAILLSTLMVCIILEYFYGDVTLRYGIAVLLVCIAVSSRIDLPQWTSSLTEMALGVYLVHILAYRLTYMAFYHIPFLEPRSSIHAIAVIVVSFAMVRMLSCTSLKRFV